MSSHIWQVKRLQARTVTEAEDVLVFAVQKGLDCYAALRFTCYYLERMRRQGGNTRLKFSRLKFFWDSCQASGHRYATGKNAEQYLNGGIKVLQAIAERKGWERMPVNQLWDLYLESL